MFDRDRLTARIEALGRIGALPSGGVCRLALTPEDRAGRDWLLGEMRDLGLDIAIDGIGNIFGTRKGRVADAPHVMIGSHIDTVATGGLYDGALGVLAGLELVAALNDDNIETDLPLTIAAFTNEEGARFAPDMLGSLVFAGGMALADALEIRGIDGVRLGDDLTQIGHAGPDQGPRNIAAYLELHIEQGPVLEDEGLQIGVVEGVQGISWTEITFHGASAHAGTTPLRLRRDAGLAAGIVAAGLRDLIRDIGPGQLGTVGAITLAPNLVNVVAQTATLTVDLRNPDNDQLREAEAALADLIARAATEANVTATTRSLARFDPVAFDDALVQAVQDQATAQGLSHRRMYSGAGHDAQMIARIAPAAMIFVPSQNGVSHNIHEYTAPDDLARGGTLLAALVRRLSIRN